jgi:hypothetical protein
MGHGRRIVRQDLVDERHHGLEALLRSLEHMFASVRSRPDGNAR